MYVNVLLVKLKHNDIRFYFTGFLGDPQALPGSQNAPVLPRTSFTCRGSQSQGCNQSEATTIGTHLRINIYINRKLHPDFALAAVKVCGFLNGK